MNEIFLRALKCWRTLQFMYGTLNGLVHTILGPAAVNIVLRFRRHHRQPVYYVRGLYTHY